MLNVSSHTQRREGGGGRTQSRFCGVSSMFCSMPSSEIWKASLCVARVGCWETESVFVFVSVFEVGKSRYAVEVRYKNP